MKKILTTIAVCATAISVNAQSWTKKVGDNPIKLQDIIEEREKATPNSIDRAASEAGTYIPEGSNNQYNRWKWYWEHHTDQNGYLVPPAYNLQQWYKQNAQHTERKTTADKSAWTFAGPDKSKSGYNGVGRINVVAFHPTDTNIFWIGSAGGGAWKTSNGGLNWTPINDQFPVMGVSDIKMNPLNPNTIYLATGDKEANDTYSVGLLKSTDGGDTWDTTGLKWPVNAFRQIGGILINPIDTNSLTVATTDGIYKSLDGGATWAQTFNGSFKQILYHPTDTNIIFIAGFTTLSNQIFRSTDGGYTWTQRSAFNTNSRVAIAVTEANTSKVMAVVSNSSHGLDAVYSSSDSGKTFTSIYTTTGSNCSGNLLASNPNGNTCGGQGWYDLTIAISNDDDMNVVVGGVNTWYSTNGGINWQIANQWQSTLPGIKVVHADKHYHAYHPIKKGVLFECNDGGIYTTTTPVSSLWTDLTNGLGITQFYRNAVSNIANFVVGGAQDNGSKKLAGTTYTELTGGDGMNCEMDPNDNGTFYTAIQYGDIRRTTNGGANFTKISDNIPGQPDGEWITPYILHPLNNTNIIAGYNKLYSSQNRGNSWTEISPSFGANVKRIAMSPDKEEYIYVLVSNGIRYTKDFGLSWQIMLSKPDGVISDLVADPHDAEKIYITIGGYGSNKVAEYRLGTWKLMNENLPDIPVYCMAIDSADGTLYIGTDFGVYYRTPDMTQWETYNNGLPNVEVTDLGINYTTNEIWAATYGRSMWKSVRNGHPVGISNTAPYANDVITLSPNPNKGSFALQTTNKALLNSNVQVQIVNMNGSIVWKENKKIPANGLLNINATLSNGTYMVQVLKDNAIFSKAKMVTYQ
ncbi:MAG: T9SS type A sorting domain-containing protein [Flavipsychrobacter sp.]|nr:T9SS type A sorting domain-containing protein [Flavipsychrobacter sp.]